MKASSCKSSIKRWRDILSAGHVPYLDSATGKDIVITCINGVDIKINHNGEKHWTIRIPGTAKDGMRFDFGVDVIIEENMGLIVINNILAIRYK